MEQQAGGSTSPECRAVERVFEAQIEALNQRLQANEQQVQRLNGEVDGHVDKLWERVNAGFNEMKQIVAEHARDDNQAMTRVENALLTRVPAWALALITTGGSIIGALGMYILTHK